ncbi:hypothetical protein GXY_03298 [Novacetimonas hansenii ATCC 23769]|uniref:Uncharacterized protein n=1 Tax=Novacetimonas hansenii ATCC 23769 TaxID=714995 RepID=D5QC13_NOVHA|nr:hypothetical protein GXY_03298 [Novacetimonas hansenii ATCC 23769]
MILRFCLNSFEYGATCFEIFRQICPEKYHGPRFLKTV